MIREHDRIVLTSDLPSDGVKAGDVGVVVHVYREGEAFEVEFFTLDGKTAAVVTVESSQLRAVTDRDLTHARPIQLSV